ncbi:30S ribosomal protein S20 [Candidatus Microgenomates bacterium]|nr:30S ribosomal protein S20 [Candidatus Microgenomates bacterium]
MPNLKASIIDVRKSRRRQRQNLIWKNQVKKEIKNLAKLIKEGKKEEAKSTLSKVFKAIDKAAKNNVYHRNTAARKKSQIAKTLI